MARLTVRIFLDQKKSLANMVMTLLVLWKLSTEDQAALLGIASSNRAASSNYRSARPIGTRYDQCERVGHLLGIHENLRLLLPQNRDLDPPCHMRRHVAGSAQKKSPLARASH